MGELHTGCACLDQCVVSVGCYYSIEKEHKLRHPETIRHVPKAESGPRAVIVCCTPFNCILISPVFKGTELQAATTNELQTVE